ncbi:YceI family protein [Desulfuromonas acetoxidans]|uniref:YceI family protein n=1 Tax=Desulfuromonas acetoxidans TaxID=891 RepID=UPI002931954C|nr:YceI family protein [Desulfuromonas acetoxidans]
MKKTLLCLLIMLMVSIANGVASEWRIDPDHSNAQFRIRHLMISEVGGMFPTITGKLTLNDDNVSDSSIEVAVAVASLDTGVAKRDAHLLGSDFFDVDNFPTMTFVSTRIDKTNQGLALYGTLTIHGYSHSTVFAVTGPSEAIKDPWGMTRIGASATTTINRRDFGMVWNEVLDNGNAMIGNEVELQIDMELIRQ